jgi:spermidine/putrescine transport system permease protein
MGIFQTSARARAAALAAPPFVYALLLLAFPLCAIVLISFWTQDFLDLDTTFNLANYREIWTEPIYTALLGRSLFVSAVVTLVTVVLAYPVAYFVSFHVAPERKALWLFLITIPFWTSFLIRVFLWRVILGFNGVVNTALLEVRLIEEPLTFILYNLNSVIITLAHAYAVFAILPIYVALEKIDRSLLEAAQDLGENRFTTFLRVTLPLSVPGIVGAVLIVFIPTIGDYITPELMGGPGGRLMANMIQIQFLQVNNAPLGSALAIVTMLAVGLVALLLVVLLGRWLRGRA